MTKAFFVKSFATITVISLAMTSCRERTKTEPAVEQAEIVSITELLPPLHSLSEIRITGDTLLIYDHKSTEKQFFGFNVNEQKFIGEFGKFGEGPGEISHISNIFTDNKGSVYALDHNRWRIITFNISKGLNDPETDAEVKIDLLNPDKKIPFVTAKYLNDTAVYCSAYVPNEDWSVMTSHVAKINLETGLIEVIENDEVPNAFRSGIAVSPKSGRIFEAGKTHDLLRIYDLEGKMMHNIQGKDFHKKNIRREYYYSLPISADSCFYAVYGYKPDNNDDVEYEIRKYDDNGNLIKILKVGEQLSGIAYHDKSKRLYLSSEGEPQFGYIQL